MYEKTRWRPTSGAKTNEEGVLVTPFCRIHVRWLDNREKQPWPFNDYRGPEELQGCGHAVCVGTSGPPQERSCVPSIRLGLLCQGNKRMNECVTRFLYKYLFFLCFWFNFMPLYQKCTALLNCNRQQNGILGTAIVRSAEPNQTLRQAIYYLVGICLPVAVL